MKKLGLEICTFINSIFILVALYFSVNYEMINIQENEIENVSAVLFLPIFILFSCIFFFSIHILIVILAAKYLKDSEIKIIPINKNKILDVLQIILIFILLLGISICMIEHNWFGVLLTIFLVGQLYLYIMWFWNIVHEKRNTAKSLFFI